MWGVDKIVVTICSNIKASTNLASRHCSFHVFQGTLKDLPIVKILDYASMAIEIQEMECLELLRLNINFKDCFEILIINFDEALS